MLEVGPAARGGPLARRPLPALAVPATLHASLMARLDRLGPGSRRWRRSAPCIGREFDLRAARGGRAAAARRSWRRRSTGSPRPSWCSGAARRRRRATASSTRWCGTPPTRACSGAARQQLHARRGRALEERFPRGRTRSPSCWPTTAPRPGAPGRAVGYWPRPGRAGDRRARPAEAVAHLRRAWGCWRRLPAGRIADRDGARLRTRLGGVLHATRGFTAAETGGAYGRARELWRGGRAPDAGRGLYGLFVPPRPGASTPTLRGRCRGPRRPTGAGRRGARQRHTGVLAVTRRRLAVRRGVAHLERLLDGPRARPTPATSRSLSTGRPRGAARFVALPALAGLPGRGPARQPPRR